MLTLVGCYGERQAKGTCRRHKRRNIETRPCQTRPTPKTRYARYVVYSSSTSCPSISSSSLSSQEARRDPQTSQRPPTRRRPAAVRFCSGFATSWRTGGTRPRAGTISRSSSRTARHFTPSRTATAHARSASVTSPRTSSGGKCDLTERATQRRQRRSDTRPG